MTTPSPDHRPSENDDARRLRELTEQAFGFLDQLADYRAWTDQLRRELDAARAELEAVRRSEAQARRPEQR